MKNYRYEMHCHTAETSACASTDARGMVDWYRSLGFAGLFITDHFIKGNSIVAHSTEPLTWEQKVNGITLGYETAKAYGDAVGFPVYYGFEYSYGGGSDFLFYGLDKAWLLDHPTMCDIDLCELIDLCHRDGGIVIQAHPFREASYIRMMRLLPRDCDGAEWFNASNADAMNEMARLYIRHYDLIPSAGTDIHAAPFARDAVSCLAFDTPLTSVDDFISRFKKREGELQQLRLNPEKTAISEAIPLHL